MKEIPELWELIALFEMEPVYIYGEEKDIPWFYTSINFRLKRNNEALDITISPADGIIDIWLFACDRKIMQLSLENVEKMKIEKLRDKEILHIVFREDMIENFYIQTKPQIFLHCNI